MKVYLVRRVLAVIPVMLVVATVAFVLVHLAPGDPASVIAGPYATADDIAKLHHQLGLDEPLPVQLLRWYGRLLRGDLGDSIFLRRPVLEAIADRLEPTLLLTTFATLIAILIGVPTGIVSARRHNSVADQSFMLLALLGISVPNFLLGLLLILVFGVWLGWFPVAGYVPLASGLWANLRSLLLPSLSLGLVQSALIARITRSSMLDVLREHYILAGRAKGLPERAVVYKHALKNAIIPTLTVVGITFAILIGGAVVIETVFNIPGLGRLIISAVLRRDYPVIQGVVLLIAVAYTLINLLVDLAYLALDPRIRYQ
ncbi:MAG: ABC transporter permease [Candidatus Rokubacteria bacterium]|nr:ABC transporter permease [Candidatus Rokubacteria bacterium]